MCSESEKTEGAKLCEETHWLGSRWAIFRLPKDAGVSSPDGIRAVRNANHLEMIASRNYSDATYALSKFVLNGTIPRKL